VKIFDVINMTWKAIIKEDRPLQDAKEVGEYWGNTIGHLIAELLEKKLRVVGEAAENEEGDYDTTIEAIFKELNAYYYNSRVFEFVDYTHDRFELSNSGYVGGGVAEYKMDSRGIQVLKNLKIKSKDIEDFLVRDKNLKIKLDYSAEFEKPFSRVRMGRNQDYDIEIRFNGSDEGIVEEEKVKLEVGEDSRTGKLSASGEGIVGIYGGYLTADEFNEWALLTYRDAGDYGSPSQFPNWPFPTDKPEDEEKTRYPDDKLMEWQKVLYTNNKKTSQKDSERLVKEYMELLGIEQTPQGIKENKYESEFTGIIPTQDIEYSRLYKLTKLAEGHELITTLRNRGGPYLVGTSTGREGHFYSFGAERTGNQIRIDGDFEPMSVMDFVKLDTNTKELALDRVKEFKKELPINRFLKIMNHGRNFRIQRG